MKQSDGSIKHCCWSEDKGERDGNTTYVKGNPARVSAKRSQRAVAISRSLPLKLMSDHTWSRTCPRVGWRRGAEVETVY
ncbi:hypothetical protein CEXT_458131 [Caerostris extrusa]|uniref:Uncharacterized protein n=1 Tax=Caerostris extrusa TaxID=172846 RepID=A0AAV4WWF2_CAEEX|nr:hypothetical protein CEXT_458131 [Caerostris extrusa]